MRGEVDEFCITGAKLKGGSGGFWMVWIIRFLEYIYSVCTIEYLKSSS